MTINGINKMQSQVTPMGAGQVADSVSRNTQDQNQAVSVSISKEGMESYRQQLQTIGSNEKSDGNVIEKKQAFIKQAKNYQFANHYENELSQRASALKAQYRFSDKEQDYAKAYKALHDEIVQGYQNGTREVYTDSENAETGFRKMTMEEELDRLDKAFQKTTDQFKIDKKATKIIGDYKKWLQQVKTKKPVKSSKKKLEQKGQ